MNRDGDTCEVEIRMRKVMLRMPDSKKKVYYILTCSCTLNAHSIRFNAH